MIEGNPVSVAHALVQNDIARMNSKNLNVTSTGMEKRLQGVLDHMGEIGKQNDLRYRETCSKDLVRLLTEFYIPSGGPDCEQLTALRDQMQCMEAVAVLLQAAKRTKRREVS